MGGRATVPARADAAVLEEACSAPARVPDQPTLGKGSWLGKGTDAGMFGLPPDLWRARYGDQVDVHGGDAGLDDLVSALGLL